MRSAETTVLKFGGELLEGEVSLRSAAAMVARLGLRERLIVVHGGGRAIDAELRARGIQPRFVDGLRITDPPTLDAVISVLAGRTNTAFVAALHAAGVRAVGLTGADAGIGLSARAGSFTAVTGESADLGLVGRPVGAPITLLRDLVTLGYVPVIASIGVTAEGELLNVNADTMAAHVAAAGRARRLVIAGGTSGVLDASGHTIATLSPEGVERMIASGEAHSGMVAKLAACRSAIEAGVEEAAIVGGTDFESFEHAPGTRIGPTFASLGRHS